MRQRVLITLLVGLALTVGNTYAKDERVVTVNAVKVSGVAQPMGEVTIKQVKGGVVFTPALSNLTPGLHGFHIHQNPACGVSDNNGQPVPAGAAGGHYDPKNHGQHDAPWSQGHLGDLPAIYADASGKATQPVFKPGIKMKDIKGRALVVHAEQDNYADQPGGGRIACGVIEKK